MSSLRIELPEKLGGLFTPKRYKVLYGGRGGAKSWGVARALLVLGAQKQLKVLCAREFQNSIDESVHSLLQGQIRALGLSDIYEIQKTVIKGKNGTEFTFAGLRHNVSKIKSYEGVDIVWVEEAHAVSKASWDVLIPTIRKEGSEIWVTFNPELEEDETYQRFVKNPPADSFVARINWQDNPWFPEVLRREKDALKEKDPDGYLNIWEGHCRTALEGAVYADELRIAQSENRITKVPYDGSKPVQTYWDLGYADSTAIWFVQPVGFQFRVIDYISDSHKKIGHYLKQIQDKPYVYDGHFLPHDANSEQLGARTIKEQVSEVLRNVEIVPKVSVVDGIEAARSIFSACWFDEDKCADGLQALRHYRYDKDPETGKTSKNPVHDWSSHGADAFRYMATHVQFKQQAPKRAIQSHSGWMG